MCNLVEKIIWITSCDISRYFFGFSNAAFIFFIFHIFWIILLLDLTSSHLLDFRTFGFFIFPFWVSFSGIWKKINAYILILFVLFYQDFNLSQFIFESFENWLNKNHRVFIDWVKTFCPIPYKETKIKIKSVMSHDASVCKTLRFRFLYRTVDGAEISAVRYTNLNGKVLQPILDITVEKTRLSLLILGAALITQVHTLCKYLKLKNFGCGVQCPHTNSH